MNIDNIFEIVNRIDAHLGNESYDFMVSVSDENAAKYKTYMHTFKNGKTERRYALDSNGQKQLLNNKDSSDTKDKPKKSEYKEDTKEINTPKGKNYSKAYGKNIEGKKKMADETKDKIEKRKKPIEVPVSEEYRHKINNNPVKTRHFPDYDKDKEYERYMKMWFDDKKHGREQRSYTGHPPGGKGDAAWEERQKNKLGRVPIYRSGGVLD